MPTCSDYLADIDEGYDTADSYVEGLTEFAGYFNENPPWNSTTTFIMGQLCMQLYWMLDSIIKGNGWGLYPLRVPYYLRHCVGGEAPEPYELTMDKILEAMWESDTLRNFHFINYIDAMRASIWNVEIHEKHLAEWYRHFSE